MPGSFDHLSASADRGHLESRSLDSLHLDQRKSSDPVPRRARNGKRQRKESMLSYTNFVSERQRNLLQHRSIGIAHQVNTRPPDHSLDSFQMKPVQQQPVFPVLDKALRDKCNYDGFHARSLTKRENGGYVKPRSFSLQSLDHGDSARRIRATSGGMLRGNTFPSSETPHKGSATYRHNDAGFSSTYSVQAHPDPTAPANTPVKLYPEQQAWVSDAPKKELNTGRRDMQLKGITILKPVETFTSKTPRRKSIYQKDPVLLTPREEVEKMNNKTLKQKSRYEKSSVMVAPKDNGTFSFSKNRHMKTGEKKIFLTDKAPDLKTNNDPYDHTSARNQAVVNENQVAESGSVANEQDAENVAVGAAHPTISQETLKSAIRTLKAMELELDNKSAAIRQELVDSTKKASTRKSKRKRLKLPTQKLDVIAEDDTETSDSDVSHSENVSMETTVGRDQSNEPDGGGGGGKQDSAGLGGSLDRALLENLLDLSSLELTHGIRVDIFPVTSQRRAQDLRELPPLHGSSVKHASGFAITRKEKAMGDFRNKMKQRRKYSLRQI